MSEQNQNPAILYREIAKKIVTKLKDNLIQVIELGKSPDLYWKLEQNIVEALRFADSNATHRTLSHLTDVITDFEDDDGKSSN